MEYVTQYFDNLKSLDNQDGIVEAMCFASRKTHIHAQYECGSARHVIITKNFVIKWDIEEGGYSHQIGGCLDEVKIYDEARIHGYSHLLAKITPIYINKKYFYVMPTIPNIGLRNHNNDIEYYLDIDEYEWIRNNITDLHSYNWGIIDDRPVIIDYAYARH